MEYLIKHDSRLRGFENLSFSIDLSKITKSARNKSYPNLSNCCGVPLAIKKFCSNCGTEVKDLKSLTHKEFKIGKEKFKIPTKNLLEIKNQLDSTQIVIQEYRDISEIDSLLYTDYVFSSKTMKKSKKEYSEYNELLKMTGKVGIGMMNFNGRPYPVMVYHYKDHICIRLLHFEGEIDQQPPLELTPVNPQKVELLSKLMKLNQATLDFDVSKFENTRQQKEEELIEMVLEGNDLPEIEQVSEIAQPDDTAEIERLQALLA